MAKRKASGVSDRWRAEAFAADKGVCSYTGKSLWVLDHGIVPLVEWDWVDHTNPRSRGGNNTIENLTCCGYFRNWIKGNNSRDIYPILLRGRPTEVGLWHAETLSDTVFETLRRHSALDTSDWYFNRSILNILTWAHARYFGKNETKGFWCGSAWKRLEKWQKHRVKQKVASFERRGLVRHPRSPDTRLLLELRSVERYSDLSRLATDIYRQFSRNYDAYYDYLHAPTLSARLSVSKRYRRTNRSGRSPEMARWFLQADRRHSDLNDRLLALD